MVDHKHGEMDIRSNEKTFEGFVTWVKWSAIVILLIIVGMAIFVT